MKTSEKIDLLSPALVDFQAEITNVEATSENPFYHSKYADLASIINAARPVLVKHQLTVLQGGNLDSLTTRILHSSGQWIESCINLAVKAWENPQDVGSAITYARRYDLAAMLNIAQEDDDGNGLAGKAKKPLPKQEKKPPKVITPGQALDLQSAIEELQGDVNAFCEGYKIAALGDLPASKFKGALKRIEEKRASA